ncbi:MAG: hypothetical protein L3J45_00275 [Flavobacteriaceae bacterium]|nr:hypothetical protein [Flavobacteriaceae bacterium]
MTTIIETERTLLREFKETDSQAVFDFGSNKEVQKYTGDILLDTVEQAKDIIKNVWLKYYKKAIYDENDIKKYKWYKIEKGK